MPTGRLLSGATVLKPDYGKTARDYARYRAPFPDELFARLARFDIGIPDQGVLDLGTGTGVVARAFAERGCRVTGLDPSGELLAAAMRLDADGGVSVRYVQGVAEATPFPDETFEVVSAGVCWHWLDAERAAREIRRILVSGGRLVIAHFDWLTAEGNVVEVTERVMRIHARRRFWKRHAAGIVRAAIGRLDPVWTRGRGIGIHPDRLATLAATGFAGIESFSFDVRVPYDHESWRGRIRSHADVGATLGPRRVAVLDTELERVLRDRFPETVLQVPHRVFAVIGRAP